MWACGPAVELDPYQTSSFLKEHLIAPAACAGRASTMRLTCLRKGRDSERYVVSSQLAGRRLLRCAWPVLSSTSTYGP